MADRATLVFAVALSLAACGGDDPTAEKSGGNRAPYQLTFQGDATFQVHGGQTLRAALHLKSNNDLLDVRQTTVGTGIPAFSVTFAPTLDPATQYHLHYWVDVDGDGVCDSPDVDHQWAVDPPIGQATFVETHREPAVSDVCASFQ